MGIAIAVTIGMMAAMYRSPEDDWPLGRHGTRYDESSLQKSGCLVSPMGNEPVKPHANTQHSYAIHNAQHRKIKRAHAATPKQGNARSEPKIRQQHGGQCDPALQPPCALVERTDTTGGRTFLHWLRAGIISCSHSQSDS